MPVISLRVHGDVAARADAAPRLRAVGDAVVVRRGRARWLMLVCPCGCGEMLNVNLDPMAGPSWRLYEGRRGGASLYHSVWRDTGCRSHFIIWRGEILLMRGDEEEAAEYGAREADIELGKAVFRRLGHGRYEHFGDIADALDAIPWDVLRAELITLRGATEEPA